MSEIESSNIVISKDIEHLVLEGQKVLYEFFEKHATNFDVDKLKRMKEVFATYSVVSKDARSMHYHGGTCHQDTKTIDINREVKDYGKKDGMTTEQKMLANIIHEYGHAFSNLFDLRSRSFEEGMQVLLTEIIMNDYLQKKGIDDVYRTSYLANRISLARVVMYLLSNDNLDINGLCEYLFGDKQKFLSMFLPEDFIKSNDLSILNISNVLTRKTIYELFPDRFVNEDESSLYWEENELIYSLWLQNYVDNDIVSDDDFKCETRKEVLDKYVQKFGRCPIIDKTF